MSTQSPPLAFELLLLVARRLREQYGARVEGTELQDMIESVLHETTAEPGETKPDEPTPQDQTAALETPPKV